MPPPTAPRPLVPLQRSMALLGALFLTLSASTPASSIFVIVPDVLTQAGSRRGDFDGDRGLDRGVRGAGLC